MRKNEQSIWVKKEKYHTMKTSQNPRLERTKCGKQGENCTDNSLKKAINWGRNDDGT